MGFWKYSKRRKEWDSERKSKREFGNRKKGEKDKETMRKKRKSR